MSALPMRELVCHLDPMSPPAEAFRVLRTNLQFMGLDRPLRKILVTSAVPDEGKTTVAGNLAVAFAQAGVNVCLVDADLRKPRVHKLFGVENWRGLTNAMVSQNGLDAALQPSPVDGLTLLTSGPTPPNPAEMLGSGRMVALLDELAERFAMVILDSPPVLAVADAAVLAPRTDGVLLVTRAGATVRQQAQRARDALQAVNARILGSVLSAITAVKHAGYYHYYSEQKTDRRLGTKG